MKTVKLKNILVSKEAGNFLTNRAAMSFSYRKCSVELVPKHSVMTMYAWVEVKVPLRFNVILRDKFEITTEISEHFKLIITLLDDVVVADEIIQRRMGWVDIVSAEYEKIWKKTVWFIRGVDKMKKASRISA